jgi:hypothetical protein
MGQYKTNLGENSATNTEQKLQGSVKCAKFIRIYDF